MSKNFEFKCRPYYSDTYHTGDDISYRYLELDEQNAKLYLRELKLNDGDKIRDIWDKTINYYPKCRRELTSGSYEYHFHYCKLKDLDFKAGTFTLVTYRFSNDSYTIDTELKFNIVNTIVFNYKEKYMDVTKKGKPIRFDLNNLSFREISDILNKKINVYKDVDVYWNRQDIYDLLKQVPIEYQYVYEVLSNKYQLKETTILNFFDINQKEVCTRYKVIDSLSLIMYLFMNPGVETVLKNDLYRNTLYSDIVSFGKLFPAGKLHEVLNIQKTTNKVVTMVTERFLENLSTLLLDIKFDKQLCNEYIAKTIKEALTDIDKFTELMKGYNNVEQFVNEFFETYFATTYYLASQSEYNTYQWSQYYLDKDEKESTRYFNLYLERCINKTMKELTQTIENMNTILEKHPTYQLDIPAFSKYVNSICKKNGTTPAQSLQMLNDTLNMAKGLKARCDKYPKHIRETHDNLKNNFLINQFFTKLGGNTQFQQAVNKYLHLEYQGCKKDKYCVIAPSTYHDLFAEGAALNHCVASYVSQVANGNSKVLFLRKKEDVKQPFYTLEVKGNKITQAEGYCQCETTEEVDSFIRQWADEKALRVAY